MNQEDNSRNEGTQSSQDQLLSEILQKFSQSNPMQAQSHAPSGDILSSILSNGELISKLPGIISMVKPMLDLLGSTSAPKAESAATDSKVSDAPPLPAYPAAASKSRSEADRAALLCAMKPYLSRERQNAIDYIIKLSRLGDILKTL